MPIVRKLFRSGDSKCVSVPKSWIDSAEQKEGKRITAIEMEVDGTLVLSPVFEKESKVDAPAAKHEAPTANHLDGSQEVRNV